MSERARAWRAAAVGAPLLLVALGAGLAALTWRAWPDPLIDFGREIYTAWRLAEGEVLQRDVAYFNGPLSPYWNALVLRIFGTSVLALCLANLALVAATAALLHRVLARVAGAFGAFTGVALFLGVFAFGQYTGAGGYNWIAPYSHELTHGIALSLAALLVVERSSARASAATGALAGLVFLTKPEPFLALALALALRVGLRPRGEHRVAWLAGGALVPPLVALALLAGPLGTGGALRAVVGAWPHVFGSDVALSSFYRGVSGLDDPVGGLLAIAVGSVAYGLLLAAAVGAARLRGPRRAVAALVFLAAATGLWAARAEVPWLRAPRAWPLLVAAVFVSAWRRPAPPRAALAAFALVLLAKIGLDVRVVHYGFALAMPAGALLAALGVGWLPDVLERRGHNGAAARGVLLGALVVAVAVHVSLTAERTRAEDFWVGEGSDAFRTDGRGRFMKRTLRTLAAADPRATLVAMPEGAMLNYLARRANPTPYATFLPPELAFFGEERMLAALRQHPPDLVALVHKDTSEYGARFFGKDYGQALGEWVRAGYRRAALFGSEPLVDAGFGIELLARER